MRAQPREIGKYVAIITGVAFVYFLAGKFGLTFAFVQANASAVWPPTGIALAAFLLFGYRVWPAILLGAFFTNVTTAGTVATSLGIAIGNTLEGLVGAYLINSFARGKNFFHRPKDIFLFVALAGLASTIVSATIGVGSLVVGGFVNQSAIPATWLTWWLGDAGGAIVFAPFLIVWARRLKKGARFSRLTEGFLILAVTFLTSQIIFGGLLPITQKQYPIFFLFFPILIWAAFRLGQTGTTLTIVFLAGSTIWGTLHGFGPFARYSPNEALLLLQTFLGVASVTMLTLSAAILERKRAEAAKQKTQEQLKLITRRQQAEATLAEAQAIAHLGSWEWDMKTNRINCSDEMYRIYGYQPQEFPVTFEKAMERMSPDDQKRVQENIQKTLKNPAKGEQGVAGIDYSISLANGQKRILHGEGKVYFDVQGKPIRMTGIVQDITRNIELGRQLKQSEANVQFFVQQVKDYAIFTLDPQGYIQTWNKGAERIKGYTAEEVIGKHFAMFSSPEDRAQKKPEQALEVAKEKGVYETEGWRVRKDGTLFWANIVITAIHDEQGQLIGFSKVTRDLTERKKVEDDLRAKKEELERINKLMVGREIRMAELKKRIEELENSRAEDLENFQKKSHLTEK